MGPDRVAADPGDDTGEEGRRDERDRHEGIEAVGEVRPVGGRGDHEGHEQHERPSGEMDLEEARFHEGDGDGAFLEVGHGRVGGPADQQGEPEVEGQPEPRRDAVGLVHPLFARGLAGAHQPLHADLREVVDPAHHRVAGQDGEDGQDLHVGTREQEGGGEDHQHQEQASHDGRGLLEGLAVEVGGGVHAPQEADPGGHEGEHAQTGDDDRRAGAEEAPFEQGHAGGMG